MVANLSSRFVVAEKKCEDKKKDECKDLDAAKCSRKKPGDCDKTCLLCVEGRAFFSMLFLFSLTLSTSLPVNGVSARLTVSPCSSKSLKNSVPHYHVPDHFSDSVKNIKICTVFLRTRGV